MFGDILSSVIRVATLPVDAANAALNIAMGGDGSKESRTGHGTGGPFEMLEQLRDAVADTAKSIDDK